MRIFVSILIYFSCFSLFAQEFNCSVQVDSRQVQGTDKKVFDDMQTSIVEFINDRQWTNYQFKTEERIDCSIVIIITERVSTDVFKATMNIVASRPVYKTSYTSTLLNYIDKDFDFEYAQFQPLDFRENTHVSNLTSVIAYYLYIILGLDFDSFSQFGGTQFYEKAEAIVNAAQNARESGWKAFEGQRNRYWLVENYLNKTYSDLRVFLYQYHREGLDVMSDKAEQGRGAIGQSLNFLKSIHDEKPGLFSLQLMLDAKGDEIINVFSEGNPKEKADAANIMKEVDPANASKYSKITGRN